MLVVLELEQESWSQRILKTNNIFLLCAVRFSMHYHLITIFPEIFDSFLSTSLIAKAQEKGLVKFSLINPRDFCVDKQKQVDDEIYGWGAGMLMKAQPIIDAIKSILMPLGVTFTPEWITHDWTRKFKIILLWPSKTVFNQLMTHYIAEEVDHLVLICGRYEWVDYRVEEWGSKMFNSNFEKVSVGSFITLGGEIPAMSIIEATARLLPWVIKEEASRQDESYSLAQQMKNIEYPQYTRPELVEWISVPEVLIGGNHAQIKARRASNQESIDK